VFFSRTHRSIFILRKKGGGGGGGYLHKWLTRQRGDHLALHTWGSNGLDKGKPLSPSHWPHQGLLSRNYEAAGTLGATPLKTQEFLCCQRTHAPSTTTELSPFLSWSWIWEEDVHHHSSNTGSMGCGTRCSSRNGCSRPAQNSLVNTQVVRRWLIVSGCWSHKGHYSWHSKTLLANLSAVQHLLCSTSQINNLHLLWAQDFKTLSVG
jgi:hypothetical protein